MLFHFDSLNSVENFDKRRSAMLAMDAVRDDSNVYVYFDAPGFDIDDIDVTVEKSSVTIEASRSWYDADQTTLTSERPQGTFRRQIQVGEHLDVDKLAATLEQGVLQLKIPVAAGSKPKKVDITATTGAMSSRRTLSTSQA